MKIQRTPVLLLLLLVSMVMTAQDELWYEENFDNNDKNWFTETDEQAATRCDVREGYYFVDVSYNQSLYWPFFAPYGMYVDSKREFTYTTSITQTSGNDRVDYGLIWSARDYVNYYSFTINSRGKYKITHVENGGRKTIESNSIEGLIRPKGGSNIFKVRGDFDKIYFYLNDKEVFSTNFLKFEGSMFGVEVQNEIGLQVDYIKIDQPNKINVIPDLDQDLYKQNLGPDINSIYSEKVPIIAADGKTLYFAVEGDPNNFGEEKYDDIWSSEINMWGVWSRRLNMDAPLNNDNANFVISVSPDNNTLYISGQYKSDGSYRRPGLSVSHRTIEGWAIPEDVEIDDFYNNAGQQSFCFSADGRFLISSIERDDSYGGLDLYISKFNKDGTWSEPINMGPGINTAGKEVTPFLAADGVTLFYSTDGLPGYGDVDVFMVQKTNSGWQEWSVPENLGPVINSRYWDAYYNLPASGEYAYMVSGENSIGKEDIFRIELPEQAKPKPVVLIYGVVLNSKTKEPIEARITYNDLITNEEMGIANSDPLTGEYKIVLPAGKSYSFLARKQLYISVSENISLGDVDEYQEIEKNLLLTPLEVGATVELKNIFFDFGKATLRKESYPELDRVVGLLVNNKGVTIEIGGHTDDKGSDTFNQRLSQLRANSVRDYIVGQGIDASRVTSKGYGESKPKVSNETEEGRATNRRVEFTILSF